MKMKKILVLLLIASGFGYPTSSYSQEIVASMDFQTGFPTGNFRDTMKRTGVGVGVMGGYRFKDSPLLLGLDLGFMNFGTDRRVEPLSSTIPDIKVQVENSYNLMHGNIVARVTVPNPDARIRPYAEGLFGFNHLFTETLLRERGTIGSDGEILRDTNFRDTALNYGLGAGVHVYLFKPRGRNSSEEIPIRSVYLNIMGRYLNGGRAEYLKKGSIHRENGEVYYDVQRSQTNLTYLKLGLAFVI